MTETDAIVCIQHIAQSNLPQIMTSLLVVPALRQAIPLVCTGGPGIEIGGVIGQQTPADHLSVFPATQQRRRRPLQIILLTGLVASDLNPVKAIPKILRAEPFGWKT